MSIGNVFLSILGIVLATIAVAGTLAWRGHAGALRLVHRVVDAEPSEIGAMLLSALYFFCTLTSYGILRPIRDAMAVQSGVRELPKMFLATLISMLIITPIYGALIARVPVRRFVNMTYQFFALNLVGFYFAWKMGASPIGLQWVYFVWVTVFALFVPSVFWSVMADTFSSVQAKRLFGFIGVGGTIGFITGASITGFLTSRVGEHNLMLVSAAFVLTAAILAGLLPRVAGGGTTLAEEQKPTAVIGGSAFAGAIHVLKSPYLAGIAGFLFLYTFGSTVLYSAQTEIIGRFFTERAARTEMLARMDLATQTITAFGQVFLTARLMRRAGLALTLGAVPIISIIGFMALGATASGALPLLATFVVFSVGRRVTEYMLTQPSRKVLFTVLSREDKYKTTNFLETFIYRAGDQVSIWSYARLAAIGLVVTQIAWVAVPVSVAYLALAVWLARRQQQLAADAVSSAPRSPAS